jgi:hypothetical protein
MTEAGDPGRAAAMTDKDHGGAAWFGYGAALWALIFSLLHVVWAAGWYVGLQAEEARKAFDQPWFLAYDLIVAGICAFGVVVALALVQPWGRRLPRRLVGLLAWRRCASPEQSSRTRCNSGSSGSMSVRCCSA